ncbi:MAG: DUF169 domain-containing protein [Culturomica sp.]|jgi:hypothetical protein|nr:DUF169 domain-containing protein [Culturomica sp.]
MDIQVFIDNYREAFGEAAELPLAFWYAGAPLAETGKTNGCFFREMGRVREGNPVSLNAGNIGCGGGKFYTGFSEMPAHVPTFVSVKERYKETPELVLDFIQQSTVPPASDKYLNIARIDRIEHFDRLEGIVFFATPDILSGLAAWAYFDNNADDAVTARFGSGCSTVITDTVVENRKGGRRTFIGCFDISVRPWLEADILSFAVPASRLREMYHTLRNSSLFGTPAWEKIRNRINLVN